MSTESIKIVHKLRALAADPENQKFLIQETGCLTSLLYFLKSGDLSLVLPALQTLRFLTAHPPNQPLLAKHRGLLPRLIDLADSAPDENVQHFAQETLAKLEPYINNGLIQKKRNQTKSFRPRDLSQTKLQVAYRTIKECGEGIESVLLSCRGAVSVTMNKEDEIVTVYSTEPLSLDHVLEVLLGIGVEAQPLVPQNNPPPLYNQTFNKPVSRYGSQNNRPAKVVSKLSPVEQMVLKNQSIVQFEEGFEATTLAARKERERKALEARKKKQSSVSSFLGQLGSFWW